MKFTGGYAMIDCGGLNLLSTDSQSNLDMYKQCALVIKLGKPAIACNVVWGANNPMTPIPIMLNYESANTDTIVGTAATLQIYIANTGAITIVNLVG